MNRFLVLPSALMTLLITAPTAWTKALPPHIYGPEPDWESFRATAEAAILAKLVDPE